MKMNLGYNLRRLRRARALKLGTAIILFAIANSGLLPAAQLWLKHNVTQQIGGGVYQGVTTGTSAASSPIAPTLAVVTTGRKN